MKHNPDSVTTVALSYAEICELLNASTTLLPPNQTLSDARHKLRCMVKDAQVSNDSEPEGKSA